VVTIGETNVSASATAAASTRHIVEAKMWTKHESYDPLSMASANDIGLIYLPTNFVRSSNVAIAYLYLNDPEESSVFTASFLNQVGDIAGFGGSQTESVSPTLKKATAKIVSLTDCQTSHPLVVSTQFCTKSPDSTNISSPCDGK
jgi:hypothetical protein